MRIEIKKSAFCFLLFSGLMISCTKVDKGASVIVKIVENDIALNVGEKHRLNVEGNIDFDVSQGLNWYSTNEQVATVSNDGLVSAIKSGSTKIFIRYKSFSDTCVVTVRKLDNSTPLELSCLNQTLSEAMIFSKGVSLKAPKNSFQSFDFDDEGNVYYSQMGIVNGYAAGNSQAYEMYVFNPHCSYVG